MPTSTALRLMADRPITTLYRLVRTPNGVERHLVDYVDGKPVSSRKVSDTAVLKDWDKYMRDTAAGVLSRLTRMANGIRIRLA